MAFTDKNGRTRSSLADINITPLVDVVLVLLIIFMITAPVLQSGIDVDVPKTRTVKQITEERTVISIDSKQRLFVGNDAGPMHIAAAVGIPTIGIFGPGEENIWFPYRTQEGCVALRKDVPCHPCHLDFCNREGDLYMECMKLLAVKEVFEAATKSLAVPGH